MQGDRGGDGGDPCGRSRAPGSSRPRIWARSSRPRNCATRRRTRIERRWLSLDLLAGRVGPGHPLYRFLVDAGIGEAELDAFEDGAATPDLIGINHYLTSDRFLDDRTHLYPELAPGGNGRDRYVDAEAVRVSSSMAMSVSAPA